jgi:hypothetical protein
MVRGDCKCSGNHRDGERPPSGDLIAGEPERGESGRTENGNNCQQDWNSDSLVGRISGFHIVSYGTIIINPCVVFRCQSGTSTEANGFGYWEQAIGRLKLFYQWGETTDREHAGRVRRSG